jgi:hypothetical protein
MISRSVTFHLKLPKDSYISTQDLQEAETVIFKFIQKQSFASEIDELKKGHTVNRNSNIRKLGPMLDNGLLHVGGRLHRASMPLETKHPIILPKNQHASNLILRYIDYERKHSGRNHILCVKT